MIPASPANPNPLNLEAGSIGQADQNATIPAEQRAPEGHNIPKTDGPRIHAPTGAYLPAEYERTRVIPGADGKLQKFTTTRRDR